MPYKAIRFYVSGYVEIQVDTIKEAFDRWFDDLVLMSDKDKKTFVCISLNSYTNIETIEEK